MQKCVKIRRLVIIHANPRQLGLGLGDLAKILNLDFFQNNWPILDFFMIFNFSTWKCNYNMIQVTS